MFWVQTQPCTPEQLEKKSPARDHTVCLCKDLIVVIARDCVVCTNDSVGPRKSSLWLSGSPRKIMMMNSDGVDLGTS